jgi:DNA-binding NarL/FixJ family response regulator
MSVKLTDRQKEVLQLVAEGMTDRQIARRLFVSQRTASDHVQAAMAALGAVTRANAVYLYYVAEQAHNRQ